MTLRGVLALIAVCWSVSVAAERSPQQWLVAMASALEGQAYQGRLLYLRGDELSTLHIRQALLDDIKYERVTHLDSQSAELIRIGAEVVSLGAGGQVTRLQPGSPISPIYPTRLADTLGEKLPDQYQLQLAGEDRVAGRAVTRLHLAPVDAWRFGYRLWLDDESALPLKVETVDTQGQALERLEFLSLQLSPALTKADFAVPEGVAEQALAPVQAPRLSGRTVALEPHWLPPGFRHVDGDTRLEQGRPVTARTYSDGIATFTLFVAPGDAEAEGPVVSRLGPTLAVTSHVNAMNTGFNVTLLGEVPPATAEKVLANLKLVLEQGGG